MKELPILFSTPMVQAILDNRKTMTRRTAGLEKVNVNPDNWENYGFGYNPENDKDERRYSYFKLSKSETWMYCKQRYQIGDKLWVKETFVKVEFENGSSAKLYKADCAYPDQVKWKSSLFMPKAAARIWLEVTNVRCDRLQNISKYDAIDEGIEPAKFPYKKWQYICYECDKKGHSGKIGNKLCEDGVYNHAINSFYSLWRSINGLESYNSNPWVFIYEFKRIKKP